MSRDFWYLFHNQLLGSVADFEESIVLASKNDGVHDDIKEVKLVNNQFMLDEFFLENYEGLSLKSMLHQLCKFGLTE